MTRPPTIRDVAQRAGVSATTVSHVYSGKRRVAPETSERVLRIGDEIGYRPDTVARTLASGLSSTLALEIELAGGSFLVNPYFSSVMSALSLAAVQHGFTFMLLPSNAVEAEEVRNAIRGRGLAGAIVVEPTMSNRWIPALIDDGVRVVTIGRYPIDLETSWVDNDHRDGMQRAVEHLARQGYERVALLSVHERTSLVIDLEAAFDEAAVAHGLASRTVFMGALVESSALEITNQLLKSRNPPDAIIGVIDRVAAGVIQAAREIGVKVPDELGVVGVGDTMLARLSQPPFTSIRSTPDELAREAIRLVMDIRAAPQQPDSHVLLPAELVPRKSTLRVPESSA